MPAQDSVEQFDEECGIGPLMAQVDQRRCPRSAHCEQSCKILISRQDQGAVGRRQLSDLSICRGGRDVCIRSNNIVPALLKSGDDTHRDVDVRDDLHKLAIAMVRPVAAHAAYSSAWRMSSGSSSGYSAIT